jgi:hypothetical protein
MLCAPPPSSLTSRLCCELEGCVHLCAYVRSLSPARDRHSTRILRNDRWPSPRAALMLVTTVTDAPHSHSTPVYNPPLPWYTNCPSYEPL